MTALLLANLVVFSLQLAAVVAAAAAAARLLGLESPRAMLGYWQGVLAVGLLLPLVQPWSASDELPLLVTAIGGEEGATDALADAPVPVAAAIGFVLVAGVAVRLAWLGVGALGVVRLRRQARGLATLPAPIEEARALVGVRAEVAVLERISRPCTFGLWRPLVILPTGLLELPEAEQRAVACHEFAHVRRRDWAFALGEELVRAALWFHPAVWWLVGRIQLTREQAVDREVVRTVGARRPYIDALVRMAGAGGPASPLAPSLFRESQLTRRVELISKEVSMSQRRFVLSFVLAACAVLASSAAAVNALPLYVPAIPGGDVTPIHKVNAVYPKEAKADRIEGLVGVETVVDEKGTVVEAKAISGPEALRQAAVDAMRQWRFSNGIGKKVALTVTFSFRID